MQKIKNVICYFFIFFSNISLAMIPEQSIAAGQSIINTLSPVITTLAPITEYLGPLSDAVPYAALTVKLGKDMTSYCFPSQEQQAKAIEIHEKSIIIKAKKSLRSCFITNISSTKNETSGRPTECEELARILIKLDREHEVTDMTSLFNEYKK